MKVIWESAEILRALCKQQNKWGMFVNFGSGADWQEVCRAAPYLGCEKLWQVQFVGVAYLFFNSEEELERHYNKTVGDDGPTETNNYDGPVRVYALTCDPSGSLMNENT